MSVPQFERLEVEMMACEDAAPGAVPCQAPSALWQQTPIGVGRCPCILDLCSYL